MVGVVELLEQPNLLDLNPPAPKPNPVKVERDRLNAAAVRVLAYLQTHQWATNIELSRPEVGGLRAVGRIHELRQHGHVIEKKHVDGGVWRYRLLTVKKIVDGELTFS